MALQLIEGSSNPSTYYNGPDEVKLVWLLDSVRSNQITASATYQGQKVGLDIRGIFDTSALTTLPATFEELNSLKGNPPQFSVFSLSVGGKTAFTVNFDPLVNQTTFNQYTDAASNADYAASLAGNDVYTSVAKVESQSIFLWGGNDTYIHNRLVQKFNDIVYGGDGTDKVMIDKASSGFTIKAGSVWNELTKKSDLTGYTVSDKNNGLNTLQVNTVERLKFTDTSVALDIAPTQNAGSVYMIYKAAFNRAPDAGGMGYWLSRKDGGSNIVTEIAQGFVFSSEFTAKYGTNPSNASYVDKLYQNVLGRAGEAGGVAYWNQELDAGRISKAAVLVQFATLAEGASNVASLIANGIPYTEFVG